MPERLSDEVRDLIEDPGTEIVSSAGSVWEVAIGRKGFRADPSLLRRGLLEHGYVELAVTGAHAARVGALPPIHQDPFDRLLVTQALVEGITLLTSDSIVARYPGPIRAI